MYPLPPPYPSPIGSCALVAKDAGRILNSPCHLLSTVLSLAYRVLIRRCKYIL